MLDDAAVLDAVVVGAGQAGLGVSYYLQQAGLRHRVLERGRIGESWRTQRWDGFRMNTINAQTVMPGQRYAGSDPQGFMTQHGWVKLLEDFAACHGLPVETGSPVLELAAAAAAAGGYRVATPHRAVLARKVVVASGAHVCPRLPAAANLLAGLAQVHSAGYRNPGALPAGAVLVVGAGQSGCQIAEQLLDAGRTVYLSTCRVGRLPRRYRGRDTVVWVHETGIADQRPEDLADRSILTRGQPQIAAGHTVSLQSLSARGAVLLGRFQGVEEDGRLRFADDLRENMRFADAASENMKRQIDAAIASLRIEAPPPEPDPAESAAPRLPDPPILSLGPAERGVSAVIWCTGLDGDFGWVRLPGVLDGRGNPVHDRGVTAWPGVFFTGLPWLSARRSGFVTGVGHDARRIAGLIAAGGH